MSTSDASSAARELNRARWGATAVNRALATVVSRADELSDNQLELLANLRDLVREDAGGEPGGDGPR